MKTLLNTILTAALLTTASAFDHTHPTWNELLGNHVKSNGVDYTTFEKDEDKVDSYLKTLEGVTREEFNDWEGPDQLAFLINLYNAATIDLVLEHYPIKSFKDEIGGEDGPWKLKFVKALGKTYTLDEVEHELIRKNYA